MGLVSIAPEARAELEAALGHAIPEPGSPEFEKLLEGLQERDPGLHRRLLDAIEVGVVTPVEAQARLAARRERWRSLVQRLFYREVYVGEPVLDKRRVLLAAFAVAVLAVPVAAVLGGLSAEVPKVAARVELPAVAPSNSPPKTVASPSSAPPMPPRFSAPPRPTKPIREPLPTMPEAPVMPEPALEANAMPVPPTLAPMVAAPVRVEAPTTVPSLRAEPEPALPKLEPTSPPAPITTYRSEAKDTAPLAMFSLEPAEKEPDARASLSERSNSPTATANSPTASAGDGSSLTVYRSMPSPSGLASRQDSSRSPATPAVGTQVAARLATTVVAVSGSAVPVVAKTPGSEWCSNSAQPCPDLTWLGEARLDAAERVQVRFSSLVSDGTPRPMVGIGLGEDRAPGLNASLRDLAPAAAQDLVRGALGGVGDFVKDLAERSRTTITDGVVTPGSGAAPGLWEFLLGRAATTFSLPQGQTAVVRVAEVPAGTMFKVLVLPGGGSGAP